MPWGSFQDFPTNAAPMILEFAENALHYSKMSLMIFCQNVRWSRS